MPGNYSMWLGYMKKNELELETRVKRKKRGRHGEFELRLLSPLSGRRGQRDSALYRSILRVQVFQAYNSPGGRILKNLDDIIGKLIMEMDLCESFYTRDKVMVKIKEKLGEVIRCLNRASNSRFFQKDKILRRVLSQLTVSASSVRNQINETPFSDRFLKYMRKRIGFFIKVYQGTIGKDLALAAEKAAGMTALPESLSELDEKGKNISR